METETDLEIQDTPIQTEYGGAPNRFERSVFLRSLGAISLLSWALAILFCLFRWREPRFEIAIFLCHSLAAFAGFYLACGKAYWWVRWLLVGLTVMLITSGSLGLSRPEGTVYFGVLAMISAGFTYAGRAMISAIRKEANPRQRFSIFGLMIVTAITAICLFALNQFFGSQSDSSTLLIVSLLVLLGFALTAQCASAWCQTSRGSLITGLVAFLLAIPSALASHMLLHDVNSSPPEADDALIPIGAMVIFMWMLLYPLWFGFHALGWTLIDPSWKLGPRYATKPAAPTEVNEVDVLMSDDGYGN